MAEHGCSKKRESMVFTCKYHQQDLLPVYCKDCQTSVCSTCVTKEHYNHNFVGVVEAAENKGIDLHKQIKELDSLQEHSKRLDQRTDEILEKCLSESECMIDDIAARADNIIEETNRQKSDLITKVKVMSEKCKHELLDGKDRRHRVLEMLRPSEECHTQEEFGVIEKAHLKIWVEDVLKTKVEYLPHNSGLPLSFSIHDYSSEEFRAFAFGEMSDDKNEMGSDDFDKETINGADINAIPEPRLLSEEGDIDKFFDCEDDGTVDTTPRRYKLENRKINSIIPIDALNAYVLANSDLCKLHFTSDGFTVTPVMQNVTQITGTRKGTVLVLQEKSGNVSHILKDGRCVVFFKCQSSFLPSVICASRTEFAIIEMHKTWSSFDYITYDTVFVAEFNEMGVITRNIHEKSYKSLETIRSSFLYHSVTDKILFIGNSRLKICDMNLKLKNKYTGSIGPKPGVNFRPTSVCMDIDNEILVTVPNDNAIHLLDTRGKFIGPLMSERDGLLRPCSVTLDEDGYLWIGTANGDIIIARYSTLLNTMAMTYQ